MLTRRGAPRLVFCCRTVLSRNEDFERKRRARQDAEVAEAATTADMAAQRTVHSPASKQQQAAADRRREAGVLAPLSPRSPNSPVY